MCFSKNQSFLNAAMLLFGSLYVYPRKRLVLMLVFLSFKDIIQGLLYHYQNNEPVLRMLTVLSWVHICFQPLFVNIFLSHFHPSYKHWNAIYLICFIYGLHTMTTLNELDVQNDPDCTHGGNDFCSKNTTAYQGKYHIAYKFNRDKDYLFFPILYFILMLLPSLFTRSRKLTLGWILFIILIYAKFNDVGSGETAAIWCFLSISYILPISLFSDHISKLYI